MAFTNQKGRTQTEMADINVTPFVDVVLVLLIIFMITAPILESGIEIDLPKTKTVRAVATQKLVVTIDKKQTLYVGNEPVNINQLAKTLLEGLGSGEEAPVFIRADRTVPFGAFAQVVDSLREAKLTNINIVTEPLSTR
jgi:biopolymer transport protein TolR